MKIKIYYNDGVFEQMGIDVLTEPELNEFKRAILSGSLVEFRGRFFSIEADYNDSLILKEYAGNLLIEQNA